MNKSDWNAAEYSVGDAEIDKQHKFIIMLINLSIDCLEENVAEHVLYQRSWEMVEQLLEHIQGHLSHEEYLLHKIGYQDAENHELLHLEYVTQITRLMQAFRNHEERATENLLSFLSDWWHSHILEEDMKYKPFILQSAPQAHHLG